MGDNLETDLLELLRPSTRADVRGVAVQQLLGLTGNAEGCQYITQRSALLQCVLKLLSDNDAGVRKQAGKIVTNLTAEEATTIPALLQPSVESSVTEAVSLLLEKCLDPSSTDSSLFGILSNLTRSDDGAKFVSGVLMTEMESGSKGLSQFVTKLCDLYSKKAASFGAVATVLMNLAQVPEVRRGLMEAPDRLLLRLMPILTLSASCCKPVVGTLLNCCFEYDFHEWLLSDEVDLLPRLLLPLAGPEEFDEEIMEGLPLDLQYLPDTKQREADPAVRNMLVKCIHKLCSTKAGRSYVQSKNAYVILRELHSWERDVQGNKNNYIDDSIFEAVDILISDEPAAGMQDLHKVDIPAEENVEDQ